MQTIPTHTSREIADAMLRKLAPKLPQVTRLELRGTGGDKALAKVTQLTLARLP
jgi:hypothetical protein